MHTLRARFKKEIVSEFVLPAKKTNKVIILCGGMPSYPANADLLFYLSKKGYWPFLPRYRGSWESDGLFLKRSPHKDVIDLIDELPKGFRNLWDNKIYRIKNPKVYVIGSSFGGPAAILASKDKRVKMAIAISPVIDWETKSDLESLNWLERFTKLAFGNGYRFDKKDWQKLKSGKFYNPIAEIKILDPQKLFIIHAKDDKVVRSESSQEFAKSLGCKFWLLNKGGHLSISKLMNPMFSRKIFKFLKS